MDVREASASRSDLGPLFFILMSCTETIFWRQWTDMPPHQFSPPVKMSDVFKRKVTKLLVVKNSQMFMRSREMFNKYVRKTSNLTQDCFKKYKSIHSYFLDECLRKLLG